MASRKLTVEIVGDSRSLERALGRAQTTTSKFGAIAKTALIGAGAAAVAGLGAAGVASVKMAVDFDASMNKIKALVGASDKQLDEYKQGVLDLAKTVPQGPKALADALYFITSSGFKGAKALDVLTASAKASAAGMGDTAVVADAVTSAVNAYGISALKAGTATDVLLATVREGKAEPEELAASIGRVIAPAEAMGVTFQEVGGTLAGLSLTGLDAAEAVTGLRGILASFLKPTQTATKFVAEAGLSMANLRKQIDDEGLLPTLQKLRDRFGDNKEALAQLFPNVRALNAFLSLTGRNAEKNAAVMQRVAGAVGDTDKAFKEASESAQFQLNVAWSQIQVAMIKFGSVALPLIIKGVKALAPAMKHLGEFAAVVRMRWAEFNAMLERNQETVAQVTAVLRVLGKGLQVLIRWELLLYGTILKVWIGTLNVTLKAVGGIVAAVHTVIGTLRALGRAFSSIAGVAQRAFGAARAAVMTLLSPIFTVINAVRTLIGWINRIPSIPGGTTTPGVAGHVMGPKGGPPRAMGGPVFGGRQYLVGERGPELFVPSSSGRIIPNGAGRGAMTVNVVLDRRVLARALVDLDREQARSNGGIGFLG